MNKYYGLAFDKTPDEKQWQEILKESFTVPFKMTWINTKLGYFYSEENINQTISELLPLWESDLALQITALVTFDFNRMSTMALKLSAKYQRGKLLNMADVCLLALIHDEKDFLSVVDDYFVAINQELLHTMSAYLANNANGIKVAQQLYIHRNTWLYRLNKFTRFTGLDLRDFDDAAFFNFWLSKNKLG